MPDDQIKKANVKDVTSKKFALSDTWINDTFTCFMHREEAKKAKSKAKTNLKKVRNDSDVRDSVIKKKQKDLESLVKDSQKIPKYQEIMFRELMIADWTGSYANTLSYSFDKVSKILMKKLCCFNSYTNRSEVVKNLYLFMNICITFDKLHLFDFYLKLTEKSSLSLLQNSLSLLTFYSTCLTANIL